MTAASGTLAQDARDDDAVETLVHLFGVEYACTRDAGGGELYLTHYGRQLRPWLDPQRWLINGHIHPDARRLPGGTGSVFQLTLHDASRRVEIVLKFSRMAQHMPVGIASNEPGGTDALLFDAARFNSPFEEFGIVMDLRRSERGPADLRIRTKRPLAIYCPPQHYEAWQLGRSDTQVLQHEHNLQRHQDQSIDEVAVHLHKDRDYVMVYGWVRGFDAHELNDMGFLNDRETEQITRLAADELHAKGFRVLDHKPRHVILRVRRDGSLLRRRGKFVYALVDFELLEEVTDAADPASVRC
jgi:hypothetical protein